MVEDITRNALEEHLGFLQSQGLLEDNLEEELKRLASESGRLSNWTDAEQYLQSGRYQRINGSGPISKVLRTLAYLLEQLRRSSSSLSEKTIRVSSVRLENTRSGCSDYRGTIHVEGQLDGEKAVTLCRGPFVWDCAQHGMQQTQAAQQLGYRCMVSFPELT